MSGSVAAFKGSRERVVGGLLILCWTISRIKGIGRLEMAGE